MRTHVYIYVYTYIYTQTYTTLHYVTFNCIALHWIAHTNIISLSMSICMYIYIYDMIYVYVYVDIYTSVYTYSRDIYKDKHTHTCMYTHTSY